MASQVNHTAERYWFSFHVPGWEYSKTNFSLAAKRLKRFAKTRSQTSMT